MLLKQNKETSYKIQQKDQWKTEGNKRNKSKAKVIMHWIL